ncbi:MAG: SCO family protein [bacterium]|nr:SCO family protein [bacterium]
MRIFIGILLVLLGVAVIIMTRRGDSLRQDQAGRAYVENESGELVLATGDRDAERTKIPKRPAADGSDEEWLTQFVLTERSGQQMGSQQLKGQPYVAGFFFSTCPSICVQQNGKVKELQEKFKGRPVRLVSISCDPEVDSPEVLSEYAERFNADPEQWLFFTGKMDYIRRVGAEIFSLGVVRRGHPEKFALVDAEGEIYGLYTWSDDAQWAALVADIERMLDAGGVLPDAEASAQADGQPSENVSAIQQQKGDSA